MASATKQSGVALDPTQYPYVDCILKEPHAPIRKGKGHERALAAKQARAATPPWWLRSCWVGGPGLRATRQCLRCAGDRGEPQDALPHP